MDIVFIINSKAGNGAALSIWNRLLKTIDFPYEQFVTAYPGHAAELVVKLRSRNGPVLIVGIGGDGTMREIAASAAGFDQLFVGSVPAGSGNDFARTFSCFHSAEAIRLFMQQQAGILTDLGEIKGQAPDWFISSSGMGFDAAVSQAVNRSRLKGWLNKLRLGKLAYLFFVAGTLVSFKTFQLTVETPEGVFHYEDVWLATVSNQPYFGGGMRISPSSKTTDGLLELTIVHQISRLKLLAVFGTVFSGSHMKFKEVVQHSGKQFSLSATRLVLLHADGDEIKSAAAGEKKEFRIAEKKWQQAKYESERGWTEHESKT